MDQVQKLLVETSQRLFADGCNAELQKAAEEGHFPSQLWQAVEDNGLPLALVPEASGGVELGLEAACAVLRVAGAFALPLPLPETILGSWILSEAGMEIPEGTLAVAISSAGHPILAKLDISNDGLVFGHAANVPWLPTADHLVVVDGEGQQSTVALLNRERLSDKVTAFRDPGGDPMGDLALGASPGLASDSEGTPVEASATGNAPISTEDVLCTGALMRVCMMAGALDRVLDLSIEHATSRVQFGRPVAKFQAVQNLVAIIAGEAAAIGVSAPAAVRSWSRHKDHLAVACAKTRAGEAAGKTARIAHQVHAAIGYTEEHILHRFTRRLWSWRDHYGSETFWSEQVGRRTLEVGGENLWPLLTAHG